MLLPRGARSIWYRPAAGSRSTVLPPMPVTASRCRARRCCRLPLKKRVRSCWWMLPDQGSIQLNDAPEAQLQWVESLSTITTEEAIMTKLLVLYHSMYGHIETMANAVAEGARQVPGVEVDIKRVPETMPAEAFAAAGGKTDQQAPQARPAELADYDAIIFGTPTRFGNMSGQMRNFLDQTGGLWAKGALAGKVASVFTSTGTGGGQEMTITSTWTTLARHGMVIVPVGYTTPALFDISQVGGGAPYGASTIAGGDGSRQPDERELGIARHQGQHVAQIASKLTR